MEYFINKVWKILKRYFVRVGYSLAYAILRTGWFIIELGYFLRSVFVLFLVILGATKGYIDIVKFEKESELTTKTKFKDKMIFILEKMEEEKFKEFNANQEQ